MIKIEASNGQGVNQLVEEIIKAKENPKDSSEKLVYGYELKEHLKEISKEITKDPELLDVPDSWTSIKLLENDEIITQKVKN